MAAHSTSHSASSFLLIVSLAILVIFSGSSYAKLSTNFYSKSCPKVFSTVQSVVHSAISKQPRQGASLLRLHFHDCFVNVNSSFPLSTGLLIVLHFFFFFFFSKEQHATNIILFICRVLSFFPSIFFFFFTKIDDKHIFHDI